MSDSILEPTKTKWMTRKGEIIKVRDMTDSHLLNTIAYLRRWGEAAKLNAELDCLAHPFNEDTMAAFCCEQDAAVLAAMDVDDYLDEVVPTWDALLKEAERRFP